jgi:hydrogenase maturation factor
MSRVEAQAPLPLPGPSLDMSCDHDEGCITCGDTAVPMRAVRVDGERGLALCEAEDGARETVETELVGAVRPGDALLVHAATALARVEDA